MVGRNIKIFISADDIAPSREFFPGITIQNQVEGTVTDLIELSSTILCIMDVGFRLVVEITAESHKRLNILKNLGAIRNLGLRVLHGNGLFSRQKYRKFYLRT